MPNVVQTAANTFFQQAATTTIQTAGLPIAGNAIAVAVTIRRSAAHETVASIADNQGVGNVYSSVVTAVSSATVFSAGAEIWECTSLGVVGTSPFIVTVTYSAGTMNGQEAGLAEIHGATTIDQTGTNNDGGSTRTSGNVTASSGNVGTNDVVIAAIGLAAFHNTSQALTSPPSSGYTSIFIGDPNAGNQETGAGYKALSASEISAANWTWTTADGYAAVIATFRGSVAVSTFGPMPRQLYIMP